MVPLSPVGKGGNVDDSVLCVGGGYGGCFCFNWVSYDEFGLCNLVNFFGRNVGRDIS